MDNLFEKTVCNSERNQKMGKDNGIHTNEEDREGNEEKKYMWDEVEGVDEAAVVQDSIVHTVGITTPVIPTERQGHVTRV